VAGQASDKREIAYLKDVIEQRDRVEKFLKGRGYYDSGPRGRTFRLTGNIPENDEEAIEMLKKLGE